jgi:hypothetical protein
MKRTHEEIAKAFGCSVEQVGAQFVKNYNGLKQMYDKSCASGRRVNGYTSEQLRQMINSLPMSK